MSELGVQCRKCHNVVPLTVEHGIYCPNCKALMVVANLAAAEPLIKDEKIRKAVRAWADMNDIKYIEPCARSHKENYRIVGFNALGRSFTMELSNEYECRITMGQATQRAKRGAYTIAELCGEDE